MSPWEELRTTARAVANHAYAPYSRLLVGAAGITAHGRIFTGCNVENASLGLTLCAECGLVSALRAAGAGPVLVAVSVVTADGHALSPCGRCRQLLMEHGGPGLLIDRGAGVDPVALADLLPSAFGPEDLSPTGMPAPVGPLTGQA
jgi:cytidine deaminase